MLKYITIGQSQIPFDENGANLENAKMNLAWQSEIVALIEEWYSESDTIRVFSSGSTGKPKEFFFTKRQVVESAHLTAQTFQLKENTTALLCLPAKYIAGKMMILRALINGWNLLCVEPSTNPMSMVNEQIDFTAMTPMQVQITLEMDINKFQFIDKLIIGGAAISEQLDQKLQEVSSSIFETYGMTETLTHIATRPINGNNRSKTFSALKNISIAQKENGCLCIEAKHLGVNIQTHDVVEILNAGEFNLLGRIDNVINSGGIKIIPEQVEEKIRSLVPAPFYLIGEDDELLGQRVILKIEIETLDDKRIQILKENISACLERFERPKKIILVPTFERTNSGKIIRQ